MLKLVIICMITMIFGCNDDQDRFERIDRLRILGTEKTPSIASFNDSSVTLTWIVATPNKTDAPVATNTLDTTSPLALPLELTNITTAKNLEVNSLKPIQFLVSGIQ